MPKSLLKIWLCAALFLALAGLQACTDDVPECERASDCGDNETCRDNVCELIVFIPDERAVCDAENTCPSGRVCDDGRCEVCVAKSDCGSDQVCDRGDAGDPHRCVDVPDTCESDADCVGGLRCLSNSCVTECSGNLDCVDDLVCVEGSCEDCERDSQCDPGQICTENGCTDVGSQCRNIGEECTPGAPTRPGFVCTRFDGDAEYTCHETCNNQEICSAAFLGLPAANGICQSNADCAGNEYCSMGFSTECRPLPAACPDAGCPGGSMCVDDACVFECSADADCKPGVACIDGLCSPCTNDGECGNNQVCLQNLCVEPGFQLYETKTCAVDSVCQTDADGNEACRRSNCSGPVTGQAECDVLASQNPDAFPNGANCTRVAVTDTFTPTRGPGGGSLIASEESAFFCQAAGQQTVNEPCLIPEPGATAPAAASCSEELTCMRQLGDLDLRDQFVGLINANPGLTFDGLTNINGVCRRPCSRDNQCDLGEQCIGEDLSVAGPGVGYCGARCEPYEVLPKNACPGDVSCLAISREDGWCAELTFNIEFQGQPQEFPFFEPAGDSTPYGACPNGQADCPSGTRCLNLGEGRCLPQCDPTARNQQTQNATCPGGRAVGYVNFIHLAQGAGAVDIYVDDERVADDLTFDESAQPSDGAWFEVSAGGHDVDVVAGAASSNNAPLLYVRVTVNANEAMVATVLPDPARSGGITAFTFDSPRDISAANANLRIAHAVTGAGSVDIYAVPADGDITNANQRVPLATGLDEAETTGFTNVAGGAYDVYVFSAGETTIDGNTAAAVINDVLVDAQQVATVFAFGSLGGNNMTTPAVFPFPFASFTYVPTAQGYCYDLTQGTVDPALPSTGVCFERCDTAQVLINPGSCTLSNSDACQFFADNAGVCFVRSNDDLVSECTSNADCRTLLNQEPVCDSGVCVDPNDGAPITQECTTDAQCPANSRCNLDDGVCTEPYCGVGEECCQSDDDCVPGSFCDERGAGNDGVCRAFCETDDPNACSAGEVCMASEDIDGLGTCRLPCEPRSPGDFVDTDCPAFQQTCRPDEGNYYCQASGDIAVNEQCAEEGASPGVQSRNCEAGALCARDFKLYPAGFQSTVLQAFLAGLDTEAGVCRQTCRPFPVNGESDCPDGFACNPLLPTQVPSVAAGICMPMSTQVGTDGNADSCSDIGRMCGDGSLCSTNNLIEDPDAGICRSSGECLNLCNFATKRGCPAGQECAQLGSTDAPSLFIGEFGICRDRT